MSDKTQLILRKFIVAWLGHLLTDDRSSAGRILFLLSLSSLSPGSETARSFLLLFLESSVVLKRPSRSFSALHFHVSMSAADIAQFVFQCNIS
jgi:hypothetical protein